MQEEEWDWDPEFLKRDELRKQGLPVEIARTERLLIRETILEDVPELYRIGTTPSAAVYLEPMQPHLEEEVSFMKAYIEHMYAFYDFGLWTVLRMENEISRVIGRAGLFPSDRIEGQVELGYLIDPAYQRQGYGMEAAEAILHYAWEVLDLEAIHLFADWKNVASVKTAKKLCTIFHGKWEKETLKEAVYLHCIWENPFEIS